MFEFVRTHNRLLQFLLALFIVPSFILVGIQGYTRFTEGGNATVAKVDGQPITQAEWDQAQQRQVERVRQQMPTVDVKMFDTPEMKRRTLEGLVQERVLLTAVQKMHLEASDSRLLNTLATMPELAALRGPDGRIDPAQYKQMLQAQGYTPEGFEARLKQDLAQRQVLLGIGESGIAPEKVARTAADAFLQQREARLQRFDTAAFLPQVKPTDAEVQAWYAKPENQAQFRAPEQATIEYVVLDLNALKAGITVSDKDLHDYYDQNAARYGTPEERHAAHILIKAEKSAPAAERDKAKARAQALLAEARKNPAGFAELAKKNSEDPGSKEQGGDLGFFTREAMVKPFSDAAFKLKPGEVSEVVESDFGFHVIKLLEARGGQKKGFEEVRAQIEDEVKRQLAQRKYSEVAEQFSNTVYEQSESLQPVVDRLKLEKKTAKLARQVQPQAGAPLNSQKFIDAVFSADSLRTKRNTEAVEVAPSTLASAHVLSYAPAHVRPLAEVQDKVRERVAQQQAAALARKAGAERLQALQKNPADANGLGDPVQVSRRAANGLPRQVVDAVLGADAAKLPSVTGVDLGDAGYLVARIEKVSPPTLNAEEATGLRASYANAFAGAEAQAYLEALKRRYKAEIKVPAPKPAEGAASSAAVAAN
jgi:peptidyl-prolyl cis-trans isomerase D